MGFTARWNYWPTKLKEQKKDGSYEPSLIYIRFILDYTFVSVIVTSTSGPQLPPVSLNVITITESSFIS